MGSHAAGRPPRAESVGGFRAGSTGDAAAAGRKQWFARAFWPITAVRQGVRHARSRSADIGPAPRETRRRWGKTAVRTSVLAKNSGSAGRPPRAKSVGDIGRLHGRRGGAGRKQQFARAFLCKNSGSAGRPPARSRSADIGWCPWVWLALHVTLADHLKTARRSSLGQGKATTKSAKSLSEASQRRDFGETHEFGHSGNP